MAARRRSTLSSLKVPLPKAAGTSCASCGWRSLLRCGEGINRSRLRDRIEPARGCGVERRAFQLKETRMHRTVALAGIALAAVTLPAERSLALGLAGGAGTFGAAMASVAPAASPVAAMGGGFTAGPPPPPGRGTGGARPETPPPE